MCDPPPPRRWRCSSPVAPCRPAARSSRSSTSFLPEPWCRNRRPVRGVDGCLLQAAFASFVARSLKQHEKLTGFFRTLFGEEVFCPPHFVMRARSFRTRTHTRPPAHRDAIRTSMRHAAATGRPRFPSPTFDEAAAGGALAIAPGVVLHHGARSRPRRSSTMPASACSGGTSSSVIANADRPVAAPERAAGSRSAPRSSSRTASASRRCPTPRNTADLGVRRVAAGPARTSSRGVSRTTSRGTDRRE